jgi:trimethylamine--corrinoid protein Co-methyltransferase
MSFKKFKFLDDDEIKKIHEASLYLLETSGVKIEDKELTNTLHDLGCEVEKNKVKIKSDLINKIIRNTKKKIKIANYNGEYIEIKPENVLCHSFGAVSNIIDIEKNQKRDAKLSDLISSIKIMNELKQLDMIGPMLYPVDVPLQLSQIKMTEQVLKYSKKPIRGPGVSSAKEAEYIVELFKAYSETYNLNYAGTLSISPESPLFYPQEITKVMKLIISAGIPTVMLIAPIAGLTAPLTVAGTITQMNASMLAFAAIANIINPKTPLLYGARPSFANMKKGFSIWGLPEIGIAGAISAQIADYYGFPSSVYGLSTTSCTFDNQAGYEKAINCVLPLLAGANVLAGFGGLASNTIASYEQLIIDNEIFAVLRKVNKGIKVNKDTLAVDVIMDVFNNNTNFLEQRHTLSHLKNGEIFIPETGFDSLYNDWELKGKNSIVSTANKIVKQIINKKTSADKYLNKELNQEINKIVDTAYKNLAG